MLVEGAEDGSKEPLSDDFEIESACTVTLCVNSKAQWEWDAASDLVKDKVFELSGPNHSIATKIARDNNYQNCMMVRRVMGVGTGTHTISIFFGVVKDGVSCYEDHAQEEYSAREHSVGWFMFSGDCTLCGNGKSYDETNVSVGNIEPNENILTMQVDTNAGTLKFWVDGKPHGPGFTSGVTGPLRWATTMGF